MAAAWVVYAFVSGVVLLAVATWLHANSVDPPLENEAYLAENPELRRLKDESQSASTTAQDGESE